MSIEPSDAIRSVDTDRVHGIRAFSAQARSDTTMSRVGIDGPDEFRPHVFDRSRKEPPLDVPKVTMTSSVVAFKPWRLCPGPVSVHDAASSANAMMHARHMARLRPDPLRP